MIEVNNLTFSYRKKDKILDDISFKIYDNSFTVILGKNGSGKTTIIKILLKLIKNFTGEIILENKNINDYTNKEEANLISYVPQEIIKSSLTSYETVLLSYLPIFDKTGRKEDQNKVIDVFKSLEIENLILKRTDELSLGECQMVMIAKSLIQGAKFLILDEPTSSLDINNKFKIMEKLKSLQKENNMTIIIISHDINECLKYGDNFIFLKEGKILKQVNKKDIDEQIIDDTFSVYSSLSIDKNYVTLRSNYEKN